MKSFKNIQLTGYAGKPLLTDIFYDADGKAKPVLIYFHGFNGFKDWGNFDLIAAQIAAAGFVCIKFNGSHCGTTPQQPEDFADLEAYGNNNYSIELYDLQIIIEWVLNGAGEHQVEMNTGQIGLIGHSRGGGICILKAAEEKNIKALCTWASIVECKTPWGGWPQERLNTWKETGVEYYLNGRTKQQMPLYYQLFEDYQNNMERLDIEKAIRSLDIPLLICHGSNDPAVNVEKAYLLKQWQPNAELFITGSDHVFGRKHPWEKNDLPDSMQDVLDETLKFFQKSLF